MDTHLSIRLLGFVQDLEPIYLEGRVSVAPLLFGSGMKVKVLDAMARGVPVVTTTIGAESIECKNGTHLMISNCPEQMSRDIQCLLSDEVLWKKLQSNSRSLIREKYTWEALLAEMHRVLERTDFFGKSRFKSGTRGTSFFAFEN